MLEYLLSEGRFEAALKYHSAHPRPLKQQLLALYHKGKRQQFLTLFALLRTEEKLEFYLRVYFFIHSIHPSLRHRSSVPQDEVAAFKDFLDSKGADLAKTNEFLQFYALPYVKRPLEHASFKSLFKADWVPNLTEKLTLFLEQEEQRIQLAVGQFARPQSELHKQVSPSFPEPQGGADMRELEEKNRLLFEEVEQFRSQYASLERNNQALIEAFNSHLMESQNKWFAITKELTQNARSLIEMITKEGTHTVRDRRFQKIKRRTQKFEKMVKKEIEELLNQSQDLSVFDKPSVNEVSVSASVTPNVSQRNITTFVTLDEYTPTNYPLLVRDLGQMKEQEQVRVLRGFSWRIIKAKNKWLRRQTIVGLVVNDVLGLMSGQVQYLLYDAHLQEFTIKLFLYISEDRYGNKVLFRNGGLYKEVLDLVEKTTAAKQYDSLKALLEILSNIWHNKEIITELINLRLPQICLGLLQNEELLVIDSILEEIVTLMLNIVAVGHGLDAYEEQINIFYTLATAFNLANDSNRNFIGAVMYTLVGRRRLWELAVEAQLPSYIEDMMKADSRTNKQQLKLIYEKLNNFEPGRNVDLQQYDETESVDTNMEEQFYSRNEEELMHLDQYIKAHEWLAAKYPLRGREAQMQMQEISRIMEEFKNNHGEAELERQAEATRQEEERKRTKGKNPNVRLPEIRRKENPWVGSRQPQKKKEQERSIDKGRKKPQQQYYSYKSPNFRNEAPPQNAYSLQEQYHSSSKKRINSFEEHSLPVANQKQRAQTKVGSGVAQEEEKKKPAVSRRSQEKPEYRIKKSSSVEKGLGQVVRKQGIGNYESVKNSSNVNEYASGAGEAIKSPPQKKTREEVLRQLNQQLKAEKRHEEQQRKLSSRNLPVVSAPVRDHLPVKKNNFIGGQEQEAAAFKPKPKLKRTPPKQDIY